MFVFVPWTAGTVGKYKSCQTKNYRKKTKSTKMKGFMKMEHSFVVSSSPHIHKKETISSIMRDVIIALIPAGLMGIFNFGLRALLVILTAVASSILSEYFYEKSMKKPITTNDLSAAVTGLLIGLNMPPQIPLWMVVIGSGFAIIIVKQLFGGLGKNFLNPALAARCFMLVSWAGAMTEFCMPLSGADAVSMATPLSVLKGTSEGYIPMVQTAFFGVTAGSIGETSALLLILGGLYLAVRKVISLRIPLIYILTFGVLTFFFGKNPDLEMMSQIEFTLIHIFSGGLMIGAFFMATDYTTTPVTKKGHIIFAVGCGILTFVIRRFGGYPEGVSFAILLMNIVTPLIDRYTVPKKFGEVRGNA